MTKENIEKSFEAARKLGFFTTAQLKAIQLECKGEDSRAMEFAIRNNFLNGQEVEILKAFGSPEDIAPGYRIDGIVGQGGAGVVYKATQLGLKRTVALKTINQNQLSRNEHASKRFEREAQIVGQLRHPNIVSAFDFGIHKRKLFLVMEFIHGIDAEKHLVAEGTLPERHVWHVALQVCHALNYAHQDGVIHRDIKPGNLILTTAPNSSQLPPEVPFVKLADFGLARFEDIPAAENITMDNTIGGTPLYMSAEQISSKKVDHQSDIYSLGVTLWHLITGAPPFTGTGPLDVISTKMKLEDQWLSEIPQGISHTGFKILKRMCRHNTADRIGDYPELISEIEQIVQSFEQQNYSDTCEFTLNSDQHGRSENAFQASPQVTLIGELDDLDLFEAPSDKPDTHRDFDTQTKEFLPDSVSDHVHLKPNKGGGFAKSASAALALVVLGIAGAAIYWGTSQASLAPVKQNPTNASNDSALANKVRFDQYEGPPYFLFNGQSFDPSQKSSGKWDVAKGEEGESVLAGNGGFRNFKCLDTNGQPLNHFAFTCGFRHQEASQLEYHLLDAQGEPVFMVSISPSSCTLSIGETEFNTQRLEAFDSETYGYHVIQIESQPEYWLVAIDSLVLGRIPKPEATDAESTIQLVVDGHGWAHFEQIRLRRFANTELISGDSK